MQPIYRHFNIKLNQPPVYIGCHKLCDRVSTSIGIPALTKLVGKERAAVLIEGALNSQEQVIVIKLRNGGKLRFYSK